MLLTSSLQVSRRNKLKKSKSRMFPDDVQAGIECEVKVFPLEFDKSDLSDYGIIPTGKTDNKKSETTNVRGFIKTGAVVLLGFENAYPGVLGWDGVNAPETKNKVYEFRTLDGLKMDDLKKQLVKFQRWLLKLYSEFTYSNLKYNDLKLPPYFEYNGQKISLTKKYCKDENDNWSLAVYNQVTFSCLIENVANTIVKLINKNVEDNFMMANYVKKRSLSLFSNDEWKNTKNHVKDSYENSSSKALYNSGFKDPSNLNDNQRIFLYYLLGCFKPADQFNEKKDLYLGRIKKITETGNNYLKAHFPFLFKVNLATFLKLEDLEHEVFRNKDLLSMTLPYMFTKPYSNEKHKYTVELFINLVRKYLDVDFEDNGCKNIRADFMDCVNYKEKYKICVTDDKCISNVVLFAGTYNHENNGKAIVEIRSLNNSILSKETKNYQNEFQTKFLDVYYKFIRALRKD